MPFSDSAEDESNFPPSIETTTRPREKRRREKTRRRDWRDNEILDDKKDNETKTKWRRNDLCLSLIQRKTSQFFHQA